MLLFYVSVTQSKSRKFSELTSIILKAKSYLITYVLKFQIFYKLMYISGYTIRILKTFEAMLRTKRHRVVYLAQTNGKNPPEKASVLFGPFSLFHERL